MLGFFFLFCVFIFFSIINIFYKISKNKIKFLNYFLALLLIIFFSFNRFNNDYKAYQIYFIQNFDFLEIGYRLLIKIVKSINGNHNLIIFITGLLLINFYFIKNQNRYTSLIGFVYILNNYMYDITQIRNTLLLICLSYGVFYSVKKVKYYYMFCLLGSCFQSMGLIYLGYGLLKKVKMKYVFKIVILGNIFCVIFLGIIRLILIKYFPEKSFIYMAQKNSITGIIYLYFLVIFDLFIFKFLKINETKDEYYQAIYKFYLYIIIFLPLSILVPEVFSRIYRNIFLFKCILVTNSFKKMNKIKIIFGIILLIISSLLPIISFKYSFYINMLKNLTNIKFIF